MNDTNAMDHGVVLTLLNPAITPLEATVLPGVTLAQFAMASWDAEFAA